MDPYRRMLAVRLGEKLRQNPACAQSMGVEMSYALRQPDGKCEKHIIIKEKSNHEQVCRN